jgi:hypothetical protein
MLTRTRCGHAKLARCIGVASWAWATTVLLVVPVGCAVPWSEQGQRAAAAQVRQAVIGGSPAPEQTGVVHVAHPDLPIVCSGAVIAPTLVVTAKHCVIREGSDQDVPLVPSGFQIGFGPDDEQLTLRGVERSDWIGAPEQVQVQPAIDAGEDVGLLYLASAVPSATRIHDVDLGHQPATGDSYLLAGYGLSSPTTGLGGAKLSTVDEAAAFDPDTGIVQTTGNGACDGDSGGPLLLWPSEQLVGVISYVGGSSETSFCDIGVTYAASVANSQVNALLVQGFAALPPCSEREEICDNGQDENCDGLADETCTAEGQACTSDVECETGLCRDLGEGGLCVQVCSQPNSCTAGEVCWSVDGEQRCVPTVPAADGGADGGGGAAGSASRVPAGSGSDARGDDEGADAGCSCATPASRHSSRAGASVLMLWLLAWLARPSRRRPLGSQVFWRKESRRSTTARLALATAIGFVALLSAACRDEPPPPAQPVIGVSVCDSFLIRYAACIAEHVPREQQPAHRRALDTHRRNWKRAGLTRAGKAGLEATCRHVAETTRNKTSASGCEW